MKEMKCEKTRRKERLITVLGTTVIALAILVSLASANPTTVTVTAKDGWVNTGIDLQKNDKFSILAEGSWTPDNGNTGYFSPEGDTQLWPDNFFNLQNIQGNDPYNGGYWFPAPHHCALIGYIGDNPTPRGKMSPSALSELKKIFVVGSNYEGSANQSGTLWLIFNDAAYTNNIGDNLGSVNATIKVMLTETPTPGSSQPLPDQPYLLETDHPCANNYHHTWTIPTPPDTTQMRIHFAKLELGSDDYLHLEHNSGYLKDFSINDNGQNFWTDWYGVNSMNIVFSTTTYNKAGWGFKIDGLETRNNNGIQSTPT